MGGGWFGGCHLVHLTKDWILSVASLGLILFHCALLLQVLRGWSSHARSWSTASGAGTTYLAPSSCIIQTLSHLLRATSKLPYAISLSLLRHQ